MTFKPMLASPADLDKLRFPLYGSPKLDSIRASKFKGRLLSRTLKNIPNQHVQRAASGWADGLDGELIVGSPTAADVYRTTVSGIMSAAGAPDFTYWVFDIHERDSRYNDILGDLRRHASGSASIQVLEQTLLSSIDEVVAYESRLVDLGYEGVILRDPNAPYKYGRSTTKEGFLLKLKRFEDSEAEILEVIEEMHNGNEAQTNELGRTKRSSHQENKVGKGRMGALLVRDLKTGVEFQIGTGFNDADKQWFWLNDVAGKFVKYKFFPIGVKDKPRHPVYLGLRDKRDL
jgi:DNA ligase-1